MIYFPPPPRPVPAHVRHASPEKEAMRIERSQPLYPDRIGQVVHVLGFSMERHAIAPIIVVFPDGERGICERKELK